jgi:hypothetical protein
VISHRESRGFLGIGEIAFAGRDGSRQGTLSAQHLTLRGPAARKPSDVAQRAHRLGLDQYVFGTPDVHGESGSARGKRINAI